MLAMFAKDVMMILRYVNAAAELGENEGRSGRSESSCTAGAGRAGEQARENEERQVESKIPRFHVGVSTHFFQ